jgi:hypothetical protein
MKRPCIYIVAEIFITDASDKGPTKKVETKYAVGPKKNTRPTSMGAR